MSVLDILIPVGFVIFFLYLMDQKFHWYKHFAGIMESIKNWVMRAGR